MSLGRLHNHYLIFMKLIRLGSCLSNPDTCRSCGIRTGREKVEGGFIQLGKYWMVNHYKGEDRFLGWLVLQPIEHRVGSSQMCEDELKEFGIVSERLEKVLIQVCNTMHPNDTVDLVYLVRFAESVLEEPLEWHIHWHMIPRTKAMKEKGAVGWNIAKWRIKILKTDPPSTAGN